MIIPGVGWTHTKQDEEEVETAAVLRAYECVFEVTTDLY